MSAQPNGREARLDRDTARFSISGQRLPWADGLVLAETLRAAVMSRSQRLRGQASSALSGKDGEGVRLGRQHRHAHYLFEDSDGDGLVDHLSVWCPDGLDAGDQRTLAGLARIWTRDGRMEWGLELVHLGSREALGEVSSRFGCSRVWESETPYLLTRHPKRSRSGERKCRPDGTWIDGPEEQIRRELALRELPEPVKVESQDEVHLAGRRYRAAEFRRSRSRRPREGMTALGVFARLHFAEPLQGPLALGGECHFGLGAFRAL